MSRCSASRSTWCNCRCRRVRSRSRRARTSCLAKEPERQRELDSICGLIERLATASIPAAKYNLSLIGIPRTAREPGRGGSRNAAFRWDSTDQGAPPTAAGIVSEDQYWERIEHFLAAVVPVATSAKVRLACHPQDPYTPPGYRGVTSVLGTVEGLKRFVAMHESPYHGLNFCQGTVAEMLEDPAREIFDVIRWFGERGKLFNVHFRNIKGRRLDFMEAFPDEGDIDMARAIAAYRDVGYQLHADARPCAADRRARPLGRRLRLLLRLHPGAARRARAAPRYKVSAFPCVPAPEFPAARPYQACRGAPQPAPTDAPVAAASLFYLFYQVEIRRPTPSGMRRGRCEVDHAMSHSDPISN